VVVVDLGSQRFVDTTGPVAQNKPFDNYVHRDFPVALDLTSRLRTSFRVLFRPIPVAARSEAWVCGRSHAGIAGSNPTGGMNICLLRELCVVTDLCERPITCPEEFYREWCV